MLNFFNASNLMFKYKKNAQDIRRFREYFLGIRKNVYIFNSLVLVSKFKFFYNLLDSFFKNNCNFFSLIQEEDNFLRFAPFFYQNNLIFFRGSVFRGVLSDFTLYDDRLDFFPEFKSQLSSLRYLHDEGTGLTYESFLRNYSVLRSDKQNIYFILGDSFYFKRFNLFFDSGNLFFFFGTAGITLSYDNYRLFLDLKNKNHISFIQILLSHLNYLSKFSYNEFNQFKITNSFFNANVNNLAFSGLFREKLEPYFYLLEKKKIIKALSIALYSKSFFKKTDNNIFFFNFFFLKKKKLKLFSYDSFSTYFGLYTSYWNLLMRWRILKEKQRFFFTFFRGDWVYPRLHPRVLGYRHGAVKRRYKQNKFFEMPFSSIYLTMLNNYQNVKKPLCSQGHYYLNTKNSLKSYDRYLLMSHAHNFYSFFKGWWQNYYLCKPLFLKWLRLYAVNKYLKFFFKNSVGFNFWFLPEANIKQKLALKVAYNVHQIFLNWKYKIYKQIIDEPKLDRKGNILRVLLAEGVIPKKRNKSVGNRMFFRKVNFFPYKERHLMAKLGIGRIHKKFRFVLRNGKFIEKTKVKKIKKFKGRRIFKNRKHILKKKGHFAKKSVGLLGSLTNKRKSITPRLVKIVNKQLSLKKKNFMNFLKMEEKKVKKKNLQIAVWEKKLKLVKKKNYGKKKKKKKKYIKLKRNFKQRGLGWGHKVSFRSLYNHKNCFRFLYINPYLNDYAKRYFFMRHRHRLVRSRWFFLNFARRDRVSPFFDDSCLNSKSHFKKVLLSQVNSSFIFKFYHLNQLNLLYRNNKFLIKSNIPFNGFWNVGFFFNLNFFKILNKDLKKFKLKSKSTKNRVFYIKSRLGNRRLKLGLFLKNFNLNVFKQELKSTFSFFLLTKPNLFFFKSNYLSFLRKYPNLYYNFCLFFRLWKELYQTKNCFLVNSSSISLFLILVKKYFFLINNFHIKDV